MLKVKYGYLVRLADQSHHFVITDRDSDYYARENFRMQLEELMRKNGKIDENRIAIRDFWYYGQIQPKNPIADASETLH
jgi:hypothetical protein